MAAKKKKKAGATKEKAAKAVKAKKSPAKSAKKTAKKAAKRPAKKVKKAIGKSVKPTAKKAPVAKAKAAKKQIKGEGDYAATRKFDKDQASFVKRNKAAIPDMGKAAEAALEGPEGAELRDAEAAAAGRSRDTF
jgi:hypothetical protein